jgi:prophage regulatory protein
MNIIRPKQTAEKLGMALPTLWAKSKKDPDMPKPIKLSENITGWVEAEVDAYIEKKVREFREQPTKRLTSAFASAASAKSRAKKRAALTAGSAT